MVLKMKLNLVSILSNFVSTATPSVLLYRDPSLHLVGNKFHSRKYSLNSDKKLNGTWTLMVVWYQSLKPLKVLVSMNQAL